MPRCLHCKKKFEKKYPNQMGRLRYCLEEDECIELFWKKAKEIKWKEEKKELKEKLKTRTDHLNELQDIFNKFIRLRDKNKSCVSCGLDLRGRKVDASHYRSVGNSPALRFNEDNVHASCVYCNRHLHGNLVEYRIRLVKLIGKEKVEFLEKEHSPKNYSIEDIKELKKIYKEKIKELKKND